MNKIKEIGGWLLGLLLFLMILSLIGGLLSGGAELAKVVIPFLIPLTHIVTFVCILIFLPLGFIKRTRSFGSTALYMASYVFGITLWTYSFLVTYVLWGVIGLVIGLMMAGVGVFPLAILASLFGGHWSIFFNLIYIAFLTYGARLLAIYLDGKHKQEEYDKYVAVRSVPLEDDAIESGNISIFEKDLVWLEITEDKILISAHPSEGDDEEEALNLIEKLVSTYRTFEHSHEFFKFTTYERKRPNGTRRDDCIIFRRRDFAEYELSKFLELFFVIPKKAEGLLSDEDSKEGFSGSLIVKA
jgi:hypothetical protein